MAGLQCPHCRVALPGTGNQRQHLGDVGHTRWGIDSRLCLQCDGLIICLIESSTGSGVTVEEVGKTLLWPRVGSRASAPPEVPPEYAQDYNEASLVLNDSPKASAALSRRCLQNIIQNIAGIKRRNLDTEIQDLIDSKTLPSYLAGQIDGVRIHGNFAAHPIKSQTTGQVMDVEPGEAEWLLDTLEGLFDFYFVAPAKAQQRRAATNSKQAEAGKPPMK